MRSFAKRGLLYLTAFTTSIILFFDLPQAFAQSEKFIVTGKLVDSSSSAAIAYATVSVFDAKTKKLVSGNISGEDGQFRVEAPAGSYYAVIDFMGLESHTSPVFAISDYNPLHDIGIILLRSTARLLEEVEVQAQKSTMELSLDKRIFNVGTDLSNAGGSATEILSNIPSVSVDADGNVRLRGSDNVRILIDGKPSGLVSFKGGSGLQQLQGNLIEKVEIITNPSARYEAEGLAGIINIVLKKERKEGFNGSFEVVAGEPTNYGAAANINFRRKRVNFFLNYGILYRIIPGVGEQYQEVYAPDTTFITRQNTRSTNEGFNNNIRGGMDFFFNERNILTGSYLFRRSDAHRITHIRYEDYLFNDTNMESFTNRKQDEHEDEPNSEYALTYRKTFDKEGHEFTTDVRYLDYWESSNQLFTQQTFAADGTQDPERNLTERSLNDEYEKQYLLQVDYIYPISKEGKLEMGVRSSFRDMVNDYTVSTQDQPGQWTPIPGLDNYFIYNEDIHALYAIYGNKVNKFSWQIGVRVEQTDVKTTLRETNEVNPRSYSNFFPSIHLTYDLPKENAMQISYSRRVHRPRYNDLSPFVTFSDKRNFFSGNPNLNPDYTDAFDLGHIKYFDKGSLTSSVYYRYTLGKIERIRSVNEQGFASTRPENLNSEHAFGAEFTSSYSPVNWWNLDFNINFFRAITDGRNIDADYRSDTYSWFTRFTSRITLPRNIDFQLRSNYEAPQQTAQGRRRSLSYFDLAVSKDIFRNNGTITLNVMDVLNSRRMRSVTEGDNFITRSDFQFRRRQVNLTISYRLRQSKQASRQKTGTEISDQ